MEEMYCIECHGRGLDRNDRPCPRCQGTGMEPDSMPECEACGPEAGSCEDSIIMTGASAREAARQPGR